VGLLLRRRSRAVAALTLVGCLALATAGSAAAALHKKPCKRIRGCTVKLAPPVGLPFTGPPMPVSHFGVTVNTAPTSTAGTGSQHGTLVTNQLSGQPITCQGYTQRSPTTVAFKLLTAKPLNINYIVTDTLTNTTAQGIQFCLAAPFAFKTLSGAPAAKTRLPDGTPGFVGLLPGCANAPATAPCLISVNTTPDTMDSSTGVDVTLKARVPTRTKGGDPWVGP
jgi:hypothetical protein